MSLLGIDLIRQTEERYLALLNARIARLESSASSQETTPAAGVGANVEPERSRTNAEPEQVQGNLDQPTLPSLPRPEKDSSPGTPTKPTPEEEAEYKEPTWADIRFQERKWAKNGDQVITDILLEKADSTEEKTSEYAINVLRKLAGDESYKYTVVEIHDKALRSLISIVLGHVPYFGPHIDSDTVFSLYSPYEALIHNWTMLEELASTNDDNPTVKDFQKRLTKIRSGSGKAMAQWPKHVKDFAGRPTRVKRARHLLRFLLELAKKESTVLTYFTDITDLGKDTISFDYLWTIFHPGDIVISETVFGEKQALIVNYSSKANTVKVQPSDDRQESESWYVICWAYDYDGVTFKRVPVRLRIKSFKNALKITTLPVYPIRYLQQKDQDDLKKRLEARGERFKHLCLQQQDKKMFEYSDGRRKQSHLGGVYGSESMEQSKHQSSRSRSIGAIDHGLSFGNQGRKDWFRVSKYTPSAAQIGDGDPVIVDFESFRQHHAQTSTSLYPSMGDLEYSETFEECHCRNCLDNVLLSENQRLDFDIDSSKINEKFDSLQYLICPPRVLGFHLEDKRWVELRVSSVKDVAKKDIEDAWTHLEIALENKDLIKDLVRSHISGRKKDKDRYMDDWYQGKGAGLVIMLYGPPGVGKTLTAESVARATQKPLLQVNASDIGTSSDQVEEHMKRLFDLAAKWQAVMLFDEADVFIEARNDRTWERNAAVAGLLRILEYYDGILILTSNRLRSVDHAMLSRMHLAIKYEVLNEDQKKTIFKNLVEQISDEKVEDKAGIISWMDKTLTKKMFKELNGRQIRNILFSAATLASGREEGDRKLKLGDIEKMAQSTKEFADDLHTTLQLARERAEPNGEPA